MSTLTSSPSSAISPRALHPLAHYATTTQKPSRSHTAITVPIQSPRYSRPTPSPKPQTADAGTQYTPKGLPPTAPAKRKDAPAESPMTSSTLGETAHPQQAPDDSHLHEHTAMHNGHSSAAPSGADATTTTTTTPPAQDPDMSPSASKRARTAEDVKIMPIKYETCDPKHLGHLISNMLLELIQLNDHIPLNGRLTRFHSRAPPGISCHDYLQRLIQHATLSPPILLSMVYYIDRLCAMYPAFNVSSLTVHRFLITAATVASKGLSDSFWTNPTYARIGGITTGELATLEMEFLQKVQWRIVPKPEVLVDYYVSLVQRSEGYELEQIPPTSDASTLLETHDTDMEKDPP
ncbi:hypothetical protein AAFC00_001336 [Neodothiora populina]|uniref:Cyclin-domain-containing protein n=1 Tax=Neodothiora populina TaxID=2781224 RepID=A0ABR3PNK7_9PEZI